MSKLIRCPPFCSQLSIFESITIARLQESLHLPQKLKSISLTSLTLRDRNRLTEFERGKTGYMSMFLIVDDAINKCLVRNMHDENYMWNCVKNCKNGECHYTILKNQNYYYVNKIIRIFIKNRPSDDI